MGSVKKVVATALAAGGIAFAWDMGRFVPAYSQYSRDFDARAARFEENFPGAGLNPRKLLPVEQYFERCFGPCAEECEEEYRQTEAESRLTQAIVQQYAVPDSTAHYILTFEKKPNLAKEATVSLIRGYATWDYSPKVVAELENYFNNFQEFRDEAAGALAQIALRTKGKESQRIAREIWPVLREQTQMQYPQITEIERHSLDLMLQLHGPQATKYYLDTWRRARTPDNRKYLDFAAYLAQRGAVPADRSAFENELESVLITDMGTCHAEEAKALRLLDPAAAAGVANHYADSHHYSNNYDWRKECRNRVEFLLKGGEK